LHIVQLIGLDRWVASVSLNALATQAVPSNLTERPSSLPARSKIEPG
jgi:hypothetical protein